MTTYPLPTLAPTIDANGITVVSFNDTLLSLQASYTSIYGTDVDLDPDTQDGQWLAIIAKGFADMGQACVFVYNQFSPATAIGAGLSSVVKINNIKRLVPSNSQAAILVVGQAGRTITNGLVGDNQSLGTQWALPASVTIPSGGSTTVTATCTTQGAIQAAANTLSVMLTPTAGWQSANNPANAAPGAPVERDATLRLRQTNSTQLGSTTPVGGMFGLISNLPGVTAISVHENDTDVADSIGAPPHSFCFSVLGGDLQSIVNIIGLKKTIGANTWGGGTGAVSGTYTDPTTGNASTINFNIPTEIHVAGSITLTPGVGYITAIGLEAGIAVAAAINGLGIGKSVQFTRLYSPALLVGPYAAPATPTDGQTYELTSVLIAISPATPAAADVTIAFNQIAFTTAADWTIIS